MPLKPLPATEALLHGHCHQKAFAAMGAVEKVLRLVPGLDVETIPSSCCGMAGAFGYDADTYDVSMKMAELSLLPAVREATRTHCLSPTAPAAATKLRTARNAKPFTSPACWNSH